MLNVIKQKGNIDYIHELTKELSLMGNDGGKYGFRVSGSSGEWNVARRIENEMKAIGLQNVAIEEFPVHSWEFLDGTLTVEGVEMPMSSYCGIIGTEPQGITAEIIDVGRGTADDYEGIDVSGKLVFCTFDILDDFWLSIPVYEAEVRGAKGVIISYDGDFYGTKEDAINCFDSQCEYSIPVGNISRKNAVILREMLAKGPVTAEMKLTINVNFDGKSSNVIGYIPGEYPDKMILLGGHMDGYFHSYQDDLLGVGIIIGIAKAMIEAGYKPKHTIAFIAHGSEEYGVTGSRYDWCIGSWNSINKIHPDWFGKLIAFLNIDAIRPGTPVFNIASTPEYHGYFEEFMKTMDVPETSWPGGKALLGLNGPWDDGYNYAIKGIPGVICGRGPAEWSYQNYHTQFDSYEIFESEREIVQYSMEHYMTMAYKLDECILPPFSYHYAFNGFFDDYDGIENSKLAVLKEKVDAAKAASEELFGKITAVNAASEMAAEKAKPEREKLMAVYKLIEGDLMKLSPWDDVVFAHSPVAGNVKAVGKAMEAVNNGDIETAVESLWDVDLFRLAYQFGNKTYEWIMKCQDHTRDDLFWGTGKIHEFAQVGPLVKVLKDGDAEAAKSELEKLYVFEEELLEKTIAEEIRIIEQICELIGKVEIA